MQSDIRHAHDQFIRMVGLSTFLEEQENLDESLEQIAAMAANILLSETLSIMMFKDDDGTGEFHLRVFATHGDLPRHAWREAVKVNDGIAGRVAASGEALLVTDIAKTDFFPLARRPESDRRSFISVPIVINRKVIGVINVSNPVDGRIYDSRDLDRAIFVALLIGKSVQVNQLQSLLRSRLAQISLAQEARDAISRTMTPQGIDTERIVKLLAKTFYREMTKAGFHWDQIVGAATEILSLLEESLQRHDSRTRRADVEKSGGGNG